MSPKTIKQIKHSPFKDILANESVNATQLDAAVGRSIAACSEALKKIKEPQGFSDLDMFFLQSFVEGMRCSHAGVRILIDHGSDGATVDAMAIARLQIESVYTWCFLLEDPAHIRLYLKDAWKKQYVRFLLAREEWERLGRARAYYQEIGPDQIERLRAHASVSEEEKKWIDFKQLGGSAAPKKAEIPFSQHLTR